MSIEKMLENKEEFILSMIELLQGKEAKVKLNLEGIEFHVGQSVVRMNGALEIAFAPFANRKKKKK